MRVGARSSTSRLVSGSNSCEGDERVSVTTLDLFARENDLQHIDLLKVDAEGHDLAVLEGAEQLLAAGRVTAVLVEVGFRREPNKFTLLDDARDLLAGHGLGLLGLYDQTREWSGIPRLRFANALFLRQPEQ